MRQMTLKHLPEDGREVEEEEEEGDKDKDGGVKDKSGIGQGKLAGIQVYVSKSDSQLQTVGGVKRCGFGSGNRDDTDDDVTVTSIESDVSNDYCGIHVTCTLTIHVGRGKGDHDNLVALYIVCMLFSQCGYRQTNQNAEGYSLVLTLLILSCCFVSCI